MRPTFALLLVATTAACASTGSGPGTDTTLERRTTAIYGGPVDMSYESRVSHQAVSVAVAATPRRVWEELPHAFEDLGIALTTHDSTTMTVGSAGFNPEGGRLNGQRLSRYLNCGVDPLGGSRSDRYNVKVTLMTHVTPANETSVIQTTVTGEATQRGVASVPVDCASTGALEAALATRLQLRLAGQ